ncbi:MAG: hypothetical protein ACYC4L_21525 [Chloroflexota bacterium]
MAKWEYLQVFASGGTWQDTAGRSGRCQVIWDRNSSTEWSNLQEVLAERGAEGWELSAATATGQTCYTLFLKRPG